MTLDATGPASARYLNYGGCGDWKAFDVDSSRPVWILAWGDSCGGCVLYHIDYTVHKMTPDGWEEDARIDGPNQRGAYDLHELGTGLDKIKVEAENGGFYLAIFQPSDSALPGEPVDADRWITQGEAWRRTDDGRLVQLTEEGAKRIRLDEAILSAEYEKGFTLEAEVNVQRSWGMNIRWHSQGLDSGYYFGLQPEYGTPYASWGYTGTELGRTSLGPTFDTSAWHHLSITVEGDHHTMTLDGETLFSEEDTELAGPGLIGFNTAGQLEVRNLTIISLDGDILDRPLPKGTADTTREDSQTSDPSSDSTDRLDALENKIEDLEARITKLEKGACSTSGQSEAQYASIPDPGVVALGLLLLGSAIVHSRPRD